MYRISRIFSRRLAAILCVFLAVPALAFDVSVKANVDNAQVFVGDMFNYEIQVTAPETLSWICRALSGTLAALKSRK